MELSLNDAKIKALLKEIMLEIITEKQELFYDIITEIIEDSGLANAIAEGRKNDFVSEETIFGLLEGQKCM